jgi:uncharacterized protein (TIGR00297 family)
MSINLPQLLIGTIGAILISFLAWKLRSLSKSGALAAFVVGTVIFGLGGWQWAVLLLAFFITSTALTKAFKNRKRGLNEKFSKGGQRDAGQVFGNGGLATLFALLHAFFPAAAWPWFAFAASLAAVNADTWATELGVLNPSEPRLISNLAKKVEKGTSGGVSWIGTLAALAGSAVVALPAALFTPDVLGSDSPQPALWILGLILSLSGLLGSLFDSLLGATVQAIYRCPQCNKETERHPLHTCGTQTIQIRGLKWLDNDLVNLGCAVFAILTVQLVMIFLPR